MIAVAAFAFSTATLIAFAATPVTGRLARRFGVIDHPSQEASGHKQHSKPTPYLGGIAISLGLVGGSLFVFAAAEGIPVRHFVLTIGASLALAAVGLADDFTPLPRSLRLVAQIALAYAAWETGFGVTAGPNAAVNLLLTTLWIVGITNAFNLLDNMDGVSAGLAAIAAMTFAVMGIMSELPVLPIVAAALSGASLGFLVHNRHPAKVFMGDAGSLLLGFLVALLGLRLRFDNLPEVTFMVPVVVLGLPILDTTLVVVSRIHHHRPVFLGARDHIAHRLTKAGLSIRTSVRLMYVAAGSLAWLGIVISQSTPKVGFMLLGFVGALGLFFGALLWRIPVEDAIDSREAAQMASDIAPAKTTEGPPHVEPDGPASAEVI